MRRKPVRLTRWFAGGCAALALFGSLSSARADMAWATYDAGQTKITLIMDDTTAKVYMIVSGPSSDWFGWGFGANYMTGYAVIFNTGSGTGDYFESTMEQYVTPTAQAHQDVSATSSVSGGTITYYCTRDLHTADANDYVFSTSALGSYNIQWAVGNKPFFQHFSRNVTTTTISAYTPPAPTLTDAKPGFGSTRLTIQNLRLGITNKVEFIDQLGATNWLTVSNLVFPSPNAVTDVTSFLTNLTVSVQDHNTNSQGFFRIEQ